jgi:hypothetical protein
MWSDYSRFKKMQMTFTLINLMFVEADSSRDAILD